MREVYERICRTVKALPRYPAESAARLTGSIRLSRALVVFVMLTAPLPARAYELKLYGETVVRLAGVEETTAALGKRDRFIRSLSPFDRQARLKTDRAVSEAEFLEYVAAQVVSWRDADIAAITNAIGSIRAKLAPLYLRLPPVVLLVPTTGKEEGNAAYCRGNAIVLPRGRLEQKERLENLLVHELFHILSRNDPELRKRLYAIIGFRPCPEIALPVSLRHRKITNPDAPLIDNTIELDLQGKKRNAVPVLYASVEKYDPQKGGNFFRYLQFRLMVVEQMGDAWKPSQKDGMPVLLVPKDVASYRQQIGNNTNYIIHPDEILADNFVHLVNQTPKLPTPRIVEEMRKALSKTD